MFKRKRNRRRRGQRIAEVRISADAVGWKRWWRTQAAVNRRRRRIELYKCAPARSAR